MLTNIVELIADVQTMGGDPLSEILAPSEIQAIAEAIFASGLLISGENVTTVYPPHFAWMAALPAHLHDCFSA